MSHIVKIYGAIRVRPVYFFSFNKKLDCFDKI